MIASHDVAPIDTSLIPDFDDLSAQAAVAPANTWTGCTTASPTCGVPTRWCTAPIGAPPRHRAGTSSSTGAATRGRVTAPDTPMYIADAALYLKSAQPSLDLSDPYELTGRSSRRAFTRSTAARADRQLLVVECRAVATSPPGRSCSGRPAAAVRLARDRRVAGCDRRSRRGGDRLDRVVDDELHSAASRLHAQVDGLHRHPDRAGHGRPVDHSAPANPAACAVLDRAPAGYCSRQPGTEPSYLDSVSFAKAPLTTCDNGKSECVGYPEWVRAWESG